VSAGGVPSPRITNRLNVDIVIVQRERRLRRNERRRMVHHRMQH